MDSGKPVNINVGVLGHVDCGKTSLCKALSTTASTAAFDSNPQSKERGITLDLGFSSFKLDNKWNFTLVDCPGHSSLIRTIIGGAQIMDLMLLVIDINKGMQPQTVECLILAQITSHHLIVVLNKVDQIDSGARPTKITKMKNLMKKALEKTKFGNASIVSVSALDTSVGTEELKNVLRQKAETLEFVRNTVSPFLMAVDHCFSIKGQGTIFTGTVLQGIIRVNDSFELPALFETKKVKSIECFRVPVKEAQAGDRVGICVGNFDSSMIERSLIAAPSYVCPSVRAGIISVNKIPFFKKGIFSGKKYHISIGYDTVTARLTIFKSTTQQQEFDFNREYGFVEEIVEPHRFEESVPSNYLAVVEFDRVTSVVPNALIIGSDFQSNDEAACRLAFSGQIINFSEDKQFESTYLPNIKIFRDKCKEGSVDRVHSESILIAKGFCKRESKIDHLIGLKVAIEHEDAVFRLTGRIESRFGQTNKVRISLSEPLTKDQEKDLKSNPAKAKIKLLFKKYIFSHKEIGGHSKLIQ